jgi:hypothetical protein
MSCVDLQATVERFAADPLAAEFRAVRRVLEEFEYRAEDQQYLQALPIPNSVRQARTLEEIAAIFDYDNETLLAVNGGIWAETPEAVLSQALHKAQEVNIPDPAFVPILAARFAAEAIAADVFPRIPVRRSSSFWYRSRCRTRPRWMRYSGVSSCRFCTGRLPAALRELPVPDSAADGSPRLTVM